jgi:hypothetical protein
MRERSSAKLFSGLPFRLTITSPDLIPLSPSRSSQDFADEGAALSVDIHRFGDICAHFHAFNSQQAAFDFAKLNQLLSEGFRHITRNGKADADAAAAGARIAVLIPISSPFRFSSAPPELPG